MYMPHLETDTLFAPEFGAENWYGLVVLLYIYLVEKHPLIINTSCISRCKIAHSSNVYTGTYTPDFAV